AQSQRAIQFCRRYVHGWLEHADPASGLIPRNLTEDAYWNAKDTAADNYPFMVLTAQITADPYLKEVVDRILVQEKKLTSRLDSLPDDFLFATQAFRTEKPNLDEIIFGAAEYAKDGLTHQGYLPPRGLRNSFRQNPVSRCRSGRRPAPGDEPSLLDDRG
ncbi:MAG: hypothetical protein H6P98_2075, partial [Candidatus Aminicenantes bacterium]|nr:hypothetical protein [Candidatus Aminicenantes bacterium]